MARFIVFLLFFTSLSLDGIIPQQVLNGVRVAYGIVAKSNMLDAQKAVIPKKHMNLAELTQQREMAKEKNDALTTQRLTEQIIEAQKGFWKRYHGYISGIAAIAIFAAGYNLGAWFRTKSCIEGDACFYQF